MIRAAGAVLMLLACLAGQTGRASPGRRSRSVCETEPGATAYLREWLHRMRVGPCKRFKECQNCCGAGNSLDQYHIECAEESIVYPLSL